ncbi:hypothetical protein ACULPM_04060 [Thermophilibacter sp. ZX-H3]|uniref:hypothetical protein n=1 Tax=unclassified Thermophilibacter TaxID=2847308 RepID=UPI004040A6D1
MRGRAPEGFLDLEWSPGTAQADFGEADFDTADGRERMPFLVVSLPHPGMSWFQVFRGRASECVCQGLADVFRHIGGVPPVVVFDNATGAGRRVLDEVREAELFRRLRPRYGFEARFRDPDAGHERGHVERKVAFVRPDAFVPVPRVGDPREHDESLLGVADGFGERGHWRRGGTWGELFESDRAALRPLPSRPFSCVTWLVRPCDERGEAAVGTHSYGAGPELAGADVAVGLGAREVTIAGQGTGELVARCRRRFGGGVTVDAGPVAELRLLGRRPGAWRESRARGAARRGGRVPGRARQGVAVEERDDALGGRRGGGDRGRGRVDARAREAWRRPRPQRPPRPLPEAALRRLRARPGAGPLRVRPRVPREGGGVAWRTPHRTPGSGPAGGP